jgi:hypothetical protein
MPAGEEPGVGCFLVAGKRQRERKLDRRAVGPFAFSRELEQLEIADPGRAEFIGIRRADALQRQHGEALPT